MEEEGILLDLWRRREEVTSWVPFIAVSIHSVKLL